MQKSPQRRGRSLLLSATLGALLLPGSIRAGDVAATTGTAAPTRAATILPAVVGEPDPLGMLRDYRPLDGITLGSDLISVVRCKVPADTVNPTFRDYRTWGTTALRSGAAAAWMTEHVAPWFARASGGRYRPTFVAGGFVALDVDDGPGECLDKAFARTAAPFTNVIAYDTTLYTGGFGGAGTMSCGGPPLQCRYLADSLAPPATSRRGAWVGGGALAPAVWWAGIHSVVHEIGHTIGWPHTFGDGSYDNPWDVMGGDVDCASPSPADPCISDAQNTLAINRYSAGWIPSAKVVVATSGTTTVDLAAPQRSGAQLVVVRRSSTRLLTLEARPRIGVDGGLPRGGVAVHTVWTPSCTDIATCTVGTMRVQRAATTVPRHVLSPGTTRTMDGVTVTVVARIDGGYRVTITVP